MEALQSLCKYLFVLSFLTAGALYFKKDKLPDPAFYDIASLTEPVQLDTDAAPFITHAGGQEYHINPRFSYELNGVVVSYNDSDGFTDIWHHKRWQDFLNIRDLCVIWGANVQSGIYKKMKFNNDSWTCWAFWPDSSTGDIFQKNALSNNHLLVNDEKISQALMTAESGDHIRLKGVLAEYENKANGFKRGTSTNRNDTGNGACETVYVNDFAVIKKANQGLRRVYAIAKNVALISLIGFLLLFCMTPVRNT